MNFIKENIWGAMIIAPTVLLLFWFLHVASDWIAIQKQNDAFESIRNDSYREGFDENGHGILTDAGNEKENVLAEYAIYNPGNPFSIRYIGFYKEGMLPMAGFEGGLAATQESYDCPEILSFYQDLYVQNNDMIGWLTIPGTVIDYPVMQTMWDEEYYLDYDFYGEENQNGCLIMDTDSQVGVGTSQSGYQNSLKPSTNLIIHGHAMASGEMFGNLNLYEAYDYGMEHMYIYFNSLYEIRCYELMAVFYSRVYYVTDEVFKYYQFFEASTQEEFDYWYQNVMALSLYDTGVRAEFGDEFLTLSTCSYHATQGRFVVVARRVY